MLKIPDLVDADVVFGNIEHLPPYNAIPNEFKSSRNPFAEIATRLFFQGGRLSDFGLTPKPGVDLEKASRAVKATLGSWEPKHEHKEAGVAFMLSEWFDRDEAKATGAA